MVDPVTIGGAGAGGGILGVVLTFFGFKSRINSVDKRVDRLTDVVQFASTCTSVHEALNQRLDTSDNMQTEIRDDIKDILRELRKP